MSREYAVALGARLRAVRRQHGMTLQQVHQRSGRRWSAVVLGSYERADRAVSVTTLADLASFYDMPHRNPTHPNRGIAQTETSPSTWNASPTLPTRLAGPAASRQLPARRMRFVQSRQDESR